MEQLAEGTGPDLVNWLYQASASVPSQQWRPTYRWVQVDEDGSGHVFAVASLCEERLIGAAFRLVLRIGVGTSIGTQTVLQQVSAGLRSVRASRGGVGVGGSRTVPKRCCPAGCRPGRCGGGRSGEHSRMLAAEFRLL